MSETVLFSLVDDGATRCEEEIKKLTESIAKSRNRENYYDRNFPVFVAEEVGRGRNVVIIDKGPDEFYAYLKVQESGVFGYSAIDVMGWSSESSGFQVMGHNPGMAEWVFHALRKTFDSIISPPEQSINGRNFWLARLWAANSRGQSFGAIQENGEVITSDYQNLRVYGEDGDPAPGRMRFFISNKKIDPKDIDVAELFPTIA